MTPVPDESQLTPAELADIAALADGSLDPERRGAVEAWLSADPARRELYNREQHVVARLHSARAGGRAPAALRARIESSRHPRPSRRWPWAATRAGIATALGAVVAAVAVALALTLPGSTSGPSVNQAASLALRGPQQAAPTPNPTAPQAKLDVDVQELYFPNWSARFGWRAVGQRSDELGGRPAITVYYARGGQTVAYTILATPPLPQPPGPVTNLRGYRLRTLTLAGRTVVTWRRRGHTCVLSASGVSVPVLQRLAAWRPNKVGA